jgi:hypothetical protein
LLAGEHDRILYKALAKIPQAVSVGSSARVHGDLAAHPVTPVKRSAPSVVNLIQAIGGVDFTHIKPPVKLSQIQSNRVKPKKDLWTTGWRFFSNPVHLVHPVQKFLD